MAPITLDQELAQARAAQRAAAKADALARLTDVARRNDSARRRVHAMKAARANEARAALKAAAAAADLAAEDTHSPGRANVARAALKAADDARAARFALARAALMSDMGAAATWRPVGGYDGGTTAGRDTRRAAVHQARQNGGLTDSQRVALAAQLADGCRTARWAGNGQDAAFLRIPRAAEERLFGTGVLRTRTDGVTLPDGRPVGADLTHTQHGVALVVDGVPVDGAVRDGSRDDYADAVRKQGQTWVPQASRVGTVLQRGGMTGLQAHALGQALIDAADAALKAAAAAEEQAALADARAARFAEEQARRERLTYARNGGGTDARKASRDNVHIDPADDGDAWWDTSA